MFVSNKAIGKLIIQNKTVRCSFRVRVFFYPKMFQSFLIRLIIVNMKFFRYYK